jgi:uncharacterized SAM-binding protein YcdF (DUF218 family)
MLVARIAYVLIIIVIATAVAAVAMVLRPSSATHPPMLEFQEVVNYSHFGVIDRIDVTGQTLTVHFASSFDTASRLGAATHTFEAPMPAGQDIVAALKAAGIAVNGADGVQVVQH